MDGPGYTRFGERICEEISKIVNVPLPPGRSAYADIVTWIVGTARDYPVEIFTTNYDLLMEEALERVRAPYFDGFTGGRDPFFDPVTVSSNDLPPRWTRLWKLHGSLGWCSNDKDEVVRTGKDSARHLVFPEHLKYEQTQKAPYAALLDRLRAFLATPDTLLISIGFSFADAHISARIDEGLAANASASVFAFQFQKLASEGNAGELARRLPNFSVYARDAAVVNGSEGIWQVPNELPSKDWGPIRSSYWSRSRTTPRPHEFMLGGIEPFARFFSASRSTQVFAAANARRGVRGPGRFRNRRGVTSAPTLLGHVGAVAGASVSVRQYEGIASGIAIIGGAKLSGRPGSEASSASRRGYHDLYGIISDVGATATPETLVDAGARGERWMKIQLVGEVVETTFERGISQYPAH